MSPKSQTLNAKINALSVKIAQDKGIKERVDTQCVTVKAKIESSVKDVKVKKEAQLLLLAFISQRR